MPTYQDRGMEKNTMVGQKIKPFTQNRPNSPQMGSGSQAKSVEGNKKGTGGYHGNTPNCQNRPIVQDSGGKKSGTKAKISEKKDTSGSKSPR